jgi:hypothetical protein
MFDGRYNARVTIFNIASHRYSGCLGPHYNHLRSLECQQDLCPGYALTDVKIKGLIMSNRKLCAPSREEIPCPRMNREDIRLGQIQRVSPQYSQLRLGLDRTSIMNYGLRISVESGSELFLERLFSRYRRLHVPSSRHMRICERVYGPPSSGPLRLSNSTYHF